jgi:hypothetical protein
MKRKDLKKMTISEPRRIKTKKFEKVSSTKWQ